MTMATHTNPVRGSGRPVEEEGSKEKERPKSEGSGTWTWSERIV